jgi:hypothetical protein
VSFLFTVAINDPNQLAQDAALVNDMNAAAADWSRYLNGLGTIDIQINVTPLTRPDGSPGSESGGPVSSVSIGVDGTRTVYEPGTAYEMLTGTDPNGGMPDVTVNVDPTFLQNDLWLGPGPIPKNKIDAVSAFRHELGHSFGIYGFRDPTTGSLPADRESVWGKLVQIDSATTAIFTGASAEEVYGGPVPVTTRTDTGGEQYYHFGNGPVADSKDLMNGVAFNFGTPYKISVLDLAIMRDLGLSITESWNRSVSGDFNASSNWNPALVPINADTARIAASGTYMVTSSADEIVSSLTTAKGATLAINGSTFAITNGTGTGASAGNLAIGVRGTLRLAGTVKNTGTISLNGTSGPNWGNSILQIDTGGATLTGGGHVVYATIHNNFIQGASSSATLTNVNNTISGSGYFGYGTMTLVNQKYGVIDANNTGNFLFLNTGLNTIANAGTIEATGGGLLRIESAVNNTGIIEAIGGSALTFEDAVNTSHGILQAVGAGSRITLSGATVMGPLSSGAGATIEVDGTATLSGPVSNAGNVQIDTASTLTLAGTVNNTGTISLNGSFGHGFSILQIGASGATLTGGGQVVLTGDASQDMIAEASAAAKLTNVNNTISGQGAIGNGALTLINQKYGIIDANNGYLYLNTGTNTITNAGTLEATSGSVLLIESAVTNTGTIEANGGTILAQAA